MKFTPELNKYFEHSGSCNKYDYYDLLPDFECWVNGGKLDIVVVNVDRSGVITHVHDKERGELEASPGMELSVYRRSIKHLGTFR